MNEDEELELSPEELERLRRQSPTVDYMVRKGIPLTRDSYLGMVYMGEEYEETPEREASMPWVFRNPETRGPMYDTIPEEEDPGTEEYWRAWAKTPQARKESVNPDADVEALLATGMISKAGAHKKKE